MGGGRAWGGSFDPDSHPASRGRSSRAGGREIESATAAAAATVGGGGSAKSTDGGVTRWCFSKQLTLNKEKPAKQARTYRLYNIKLGGI